MTTTLPLDDAQLEVLADALAERIAPRLARRPLVDAAELARVLGVKREWVYEHAVLLGAKRLDEDGEGKKKKPRLRFDVEKAIDALPCLGGRESEASAEPVREPFAPARRRRRSGTRSRSLPERALEVRGRRVV